jgi:CheY-like chemotaxis protein
LIQKLLIFSHREDLRPQSVDLNQLLGDTIVLLQRTLGENIEIETVKEANLWKAQADPSQLETSLLNLAVNARDAMPGGGILTVETANTQLDKEYADRHHELRPGDYIMLAVSDTGTGMTVEVIEHAFDPFYTTKKPGKGSGLGLSMVYSFVKQSAGHIKIYSELGKGTSLKIYLPRTENLESVSLSSSVQPDLSSAHGEKLLVVEDDDDVRELAKLFLTDMGFDVLDAADGRQAIKTLKQEQDIDILFVDLVMPGGKSGLEVAQEAKRLFPAIKVLFTSGYGNNAIHHHGQFDQNTCILGKPYDKGKLAGAINQLMEDSSKK